MGMLADRRNCEGLLNGPNEYNQSNHPAALPNTSSQQILSHIPHSSGDSSFQSDTRAKNFPLQTNQNTQQDT